MKISDTYVGDYNWFIGSSSGVEEIDLSRAALYTTKNPGESNHVLDEIEGGSIKALTGATMDFFLQNQASIPVAWRSAEKVYFFGTIYKAYKYRDPIGSFQGYIVRYICWYESEKRWLEGYDYARYCDDNEPNFDKKFDGISVAILAE